MFQLKSNYLLSDLQDFTGIITITTAGTPVTGNDVTNSFGFVLKGHVDNTDSVWIFPVGATKAAGYPLDPGQDVYVPVANLNMLQFDADVSGEKICWIKSTLE